MNNLFNMSKGVINFWHCCFHCPESLSFPGSALMRGWGKG